LPNHKSCYKRMKQSEQDRLRNRALRSQLRASIKAVRAETTKDEAAKKLQEAICMLDKAAANGVLHWKNADRNKSRLALYVNRLG